MEFARYRGGTAMYVKHLEIDRSTYSRYHCDSSAQPDARACFIHMNLIDDEAAARSGSASPELIRTHLSKVLASRTFAQASRACRFLEFIVDAALTGRSDSLKETTIGVAVFDRDPGYDPKTDPVVRNAARRLRDLLERYYVDHDPGEPVRFSLPKGGYALRVEMSAAPVLNGVGDSALDKASNPESALISVPPRTPRNRPAALIAVTLCLLFVSGIFAWRQWTARGRRNQFQVLPVTSTIGESFQPSIAPNSRDIAYVWDGGPGGRANYDVYLRIGDKPPFRLTANPDHDLHPAWSPSGDRIAYVRASRGSMNVFVRRVSPMDQERKVAAITGLYYGIWQPEASEILGGPGPAWMPEGQSLLITSASEDGRCCGIFEVAVDGSFRRQVTNPIDGAHDFYPTVSPGGRLIAFARYKSHSTAAIHVFDRQSRETRQVTFDYSDIRGLAWTPDARAVVFSSNRGGSYGLWTVPLATGVARVVVAPARNAREPAVSSDGQLIFADIGDQMDLMSAGLAGASGRSPVSGLPLAPSSRRTHSPRFSPDGRQVAFLSDRAGTLEIWVANADGSSVRRVSYMGGPYVGSPHWSPDANWIVFDSRVDGHSAIFVVGAQGGQARRVSVNSFEEKRPSWSRDGQWIYFTSNRSGEARVWKMSVDGKVAKQITDRLAFENSESTDGRYLYFSDRNMGVWRVPTGGGPSEALPGLESKRADLDWVVTDSGIAYVDDLSARDEVLFYNFKQRRSVQLARFERPLASAIPSFTISPGLRHLIYAQAGPRQSDLVAVRGWYRE